ncbi:MAG TPA: diaminopimelate epimerase [Nitrospirales bacterium]|nr:diaminopimelate epimerase [Nitrospirales bacterium]
MKKVPKKIPFMKFSGAGNDFIVVDNRSRVVGPRRISAFVTNVCARRLSVGADGLIFLEKSPKANFRWRFYNNDGGEADFCGNGARCVARFAYLKRIAPKKMRFEGPAGVVEAMVDGERVTVRVPDPTDLRLNIRLDVPPHRRRGTELTALSQPGQLGMAVEGHAIKTGVPHFVYFVHDTSTAEVIGLGRQIRYHAAFKPAGPNVDFVEVVDRHTIRIRTYERGVEDETLACGSGAIAAALIAAVIHKVESPVTVVPLSRSPLAVSFRVDGPRFTDITLTGEARAVFEGYMHSDAWEYTLR